MNTKYIELSQVLEVLDSCSCWWAHERMEHIPAADVQSVRRGEWLPIIEANEYGEPYQDGCYCSECNEVLLYETNFCPNCGANMRAEEGET